MKERINLFIGSKLYTYIKIHYGHFYNGYILKLEEDRIIFKDDKIGELPILLTDIKHILLSKRYSHGRVA